MKNALQKRFRKGISVIAACAIIATNISPWLVTSYASEVSEEALYEGADDFYGDTPEEYLVTPTITETPEAVPTEAPEEGYAEPTEAPDAVEEYESAEAPYENADSEVPDSYEIEEEDPDGDGIVEGEEAPDEVSDEDLFEEESETPDGQVLENAPSVIFEESTDEVRVTVVAGVGVFPEGTTMEVKPTEDEETINKVSETVEDEKTKVMEVKAVEVTFYNAEHEEIEPNGPVFVTLEDLTKVKEERAEEDIEEVTDQTQTTEEAKAVHVTDEGECSLMAAASEEDLQYLPMEWEEDQAEESIKKIEQLSEEATVAFLTETFSTYALVYTVDFHWEVDGKVYDFSIPGGGFVSFEHLVEVLGIGANDTITENEGEDQTENADEAADYDDDAQENAHTFDEAIRLNEVEVSESTKQFAAEVESVEFSDSELVWVGKVDESATVGELKEVNGLDVEYSADLTEDQIEEINAQTIEAGDWALISLLPFTSEESLTVTMKNGEVFTIQVTDAQEISDSGAGTIDVSKSYLICYEVGGTYYLLKNDESVDSSHTPSNFESLNSSYCWTFNFVFHEKDRPESLSYNYYLIRPIDNKTKTIALNAEGEPLLQQSNNNVAVVPVDGGGFRLIGYNGVKLNFEDGTFSAKQSTEQNPFDGITVHIYEMDSLPTYDYTVRSADETRGTVTVQGGIQHTETHDGISTHYYDASSNAEKYNAGTITATPNSHINSELNSWETGYGQNKWEFDHWEQDGIPLDRVQYPATINTGVLPIPFNGSNLVAYFRQNSDYVVPDSEKEASSIADMTDWFNGLTKRSIPLDSSATDKTAEVYDYENRIYRVDLTSKANFETFNGDIDMAFCLDVSNSMKFPSKLVEANTNFNNNTNPIPIYHINDSGWWGDNKGWLDTSRGYSNPYYLIADATGTATVFRIYYKDGYWKAQDASRQSESDKSFKIGQEDFETNYGQDKRHPFTKGDNDDSTYMIYSAGDSGRNRFFYLNQTLNSTTTDLQTIMNLLAVAGDESPDVNVAYNTFNKDLGKQRSDFSLVSPLTIDFAYSAGGGTRPDQAFNDAQGFHWTGEYDSQTGETDRYVVFITDGAPQGKRDKESNNVDPVEEARKAATNLKTNSHVKMITVGLSMENVSSGRQLLYDIADTDKDGNKMFYLAESASDLPNIMRQIIKTIMAEATVYADVKDTVGDAFYLVDKSTGMPLNANDMIDIEGCRTTDSNQAAGIVQADGKTIKWLHQSIDQENGWHGSLYVKAKEDLIGGNAVKTNSEAEIKATSYKVSGNEKQFDESLVHDKLTALIIDPESPRVNVNELHFPGTDTEWTVYLGTEVNPKEQLQKLYENILVEEVVNEDGGLHYSLTPNSITDDRNGDASGTPQKFAISSVIFEMIKSDSTLSNKYVENNTLNWDAFLTDAIKDGGIIVPYHPYGIEGEDSRIVISITKTIQSGEETDFINKSPHTTTVVNDEDEVEKYILSVKYYPDYDHVLPTGQGGQSTENFHTGTYGTMYQGHSAGNDVCDNTHKINVLAKKLKILKADQDGNTITSDSATFVLCRKATETEQEDPNVTKMTLAGLPGDYVAVQTLTTNGGSVTTDAIPLLANNEPYYLVETKAPDGYYMLTDPLKVTIDMTGHNTWTKIADSSTLSNKPNPYVLSNWLQEATIKLWNLDDTAYDPSHNPVYDHINDTTDASVIYRILNSAGEPLPETGGPGTRGFLYTGLALMLFATMAAFVWRRKRI